MLKEAMLENVSFASVSIISSCEYEGAYGNLNLITACTREMYETKRIGGRRKIDFPPRAQQRHERSEGSEVPSRRVGAGFSLRKKRRRERSREPRPRNSTRDSQRSC